MHVLDAAEALDLVVVDDRDEVVEPVVGREERGLPGRAFVALAVAEQAEDAVVACRRAGRERHARRRAAGRGRASRSRPRRPACPCASRGRRAASRPRRTSRAARAGRTRLGEHRVERGAAVALAEDEAVAIGPVRLRRGRSAGSCRRAPRGCRRSRAQSRRATRSRATSSGRSALRIRRASSSTGASAGSLATEPLVSGTAGRRPHVVLGDPAAGAGPGQTRRGRRRARPRRAWRSGSRGRPSHVGAGTARDDRHVDGRDGCRLIDCRRWFARGEHVTEQRLDLERSRPARRRGAGCPTPVPRPR